MPKSGAPIGGEVFLVVLEEGRRKRLPYLNACRFLRFGLLGILGMFEIIGKNFIAPGISEKGNRIISIFGQVQVKRPTVIRFSGEGEAGNGNST